MKTTCLILLCAASLARAANGDLDTSFGSNGVARTGLVDQTGSNSCKPLVQPDGKILICGTRASNGPSGGNFLVARFNANGTLDTSFNGSGLVTIDFDGGAGGAAGDIAGAIAIQSDGRIVVGGTARSAAPRSGDFAVARLMPDGTLDLSFGSGTGKATVGFDLYAGSGDDLLSALTLQPDGKIVLAGSAQTSAGSSQFAVARLLGDGTRDSSFNLAGKASFGFAIPGASYEMDAARYVAIDASGRIVLGGSTSYLDASSRGRALFCAARLLPNGQFDAGFNTNGKTTIAFDPGTGASNANAFSGLLLRSGSLVLVGYANGSSTSTANNDMAITRLLPNGLLDNAFGFAGKALIAFDLIPNGYDAALGVAEQRNGKLVLAGESLGPDAGSLPSQVPTTARLNADGSLDPSYGSYGKQTYDLGLGSQQVFFGVALQGTQIIAAGTSWVPNGNSTGTDSVVVRLRNDLIFADGFE